MYSTVHTGLKVSYDKTVLYRIGSIAHTNAKVYTVKNVKWTNSPINSLGIDLFQTKEEMKINFNKIVLKLRTVSNLWFYRSLTLMGKIQVINTLMASLFVYKLDALPLIPSDIVQEVEKTFEEFLWKGKRAKLPLKILQKEKKYGGLGLVDITMRQQAFHIGWVKLIQTNEQC